MRSAIEAEALQKMERASIRNDDRWRTVFESHRNDAILEDS